MKKLIICFTILILASTIIADPTLEIILKAGKNEITIEEDFYPIFASTFLKENPEIDSITLISEYQSLGYVRAFGGVGTDFIIEPGRTYEIHSSQNKTIFLR